MSETSTAANSRPARGTRPANRRELIMAATTELFYLHGYANVGMSDIAEAVGVGPSAVYRHFTSKQQLLHAVIGDVIDQSNRLLDDVRGGRTLVSSLAAAAIAQHRAGVLWRREARHLAPEPRDALGEQVRVFRRRVASLIGDRRTELSGNELNLLAHCAIGIAASISFHNLRLPDPEFANLLTELIETVIDADVPTLTPIAAITPQVSAQGGTRREHILTAAIELFARNGYAAVGMEEIGAAVGIAGPSVYNHFANKDDILIAALSRGAEWLRIDMNRALAVAGDPADAQRRLIASYSDFIFDNPDLLHVLLTEVIHVPNPQRERIRDLQLDYISDWVRTIRADHPQRTTLSTRIRIHAVLGMLNDVALDHNPRRFAELSQIAQAIAIGLL